jgi:hypothetical protein
MKRENQKLRGLLSRLKQAGLDKSERVCVNCLGICRAAPAGVYENGNAGCGRVCDCGSYLFERVDLYNMRYRSGLVKAA